MKRFLLVIMSAILALSLASCLAPADDGGNGGKPAKESKYFFTVASKENFAVKIDADMADVLAVLGEPLKYFEAASCAFDGLDKTYTYAGYIILTRPDGKKDYVNSIQITDDSVSTPEGAYIGLPADAVKDLYGAPKSETDTLITYSEGNTVLNFVIKDAKVISIEYIPA